MHGCTNGGMHNNLIILVVQSIVVGESHHVFHRPSFLASSFLPGSLFFFLLPLFSPRSGDARDCYQKEKGLWADGWVGLGGGQTRELKHDMHKVIEPKRPPSFAAF